VDVVIGDTIQSELIAQPSIYLCQFQGCGQLIYF